jgi:FtsH-binding integral membrane protein
MDFSTINIQLLIAATVAIVAVTLHIYALEVWIWPKLKVEGFPAYPFGSPSVVMNFFRTVWHFFTVSWLLTIVVCIGVAFGQLIPYGPLLIIFLVIFWILIGVEIFVVTALSLKPGESYIKTMVKTFYWVIILVMVFFMFWGIRPSWWTRL